MASVSSRSHSGAPLRSWRCSWSSKHSSAVRRFSTSRVMSCEMSSLADGEMSFQAGSSNSYSALLILASMTRSRFLGSQKGG